MDNIWIFQTGEPMHTDKDSFRPMRAMNLADVLIEKGHEVRIVTTRFFHHNKSQRIVSSNIVRPKDKLEIAFINSPGYQRNIGPMRFIDHLVAARNLRKHLSEQRKQPDFCFIGYPPIEFAAVASAWAKENRIPSIVDVKDQWPDMFLDYVPSGLKWAGNLLLWPYDRAAVRTLQRANGLSGPSPSYVAWAARKANRLPDTNDIPVPLVSPEMSSYRTDESGGSSEISALLNPDAIKLLFVGVHNAVFEFEPMAQLAHCLERDQHFQFIICGDGPYLNRTKNIFTGVPNVVFPGWVNRQQYRALAKQSTFSIAPYKNIPNFVDNVPNKIVDSISLGLIVLWPLEGEVKRLIDQHQIGLAYNREGIPALAEAIRKVCADPALLARMKKNCNTLFEALFGFELVYDRLSAHISNLIEESREARERPV